MGIARCGVALGMAGAAVLLSLLAGCKTQQHTLGDSQTLESEADTRVVVSRPGSFSAGTKGSFQPRQVVCTEPSPDVAKAVSRSFNMSAALEAVVKQPQANADVAAKAAGEISKAQAEALAQLTSRLATIPQTQFQWSMT